MPEPHAHTGPASFDVAPAAAGSASRAPLHLTFDDGPGPEGTRDVVAALAAAGARATFFVLGERVRAYPELVGELASAGHRVELHGDAHLDHRAVDAALLATDTDGAIGAMRTSGVEPMWWRLPWGRPGPATAAIARDRGLRIIGWHVDTHDWRGDSPADQPRAFADVALLGGVVLMHDGFGPGATRSTTANTIALIEAITAAAARAGTAVVPLPDPGGADAADLPDGAAQLPASDPAPTNPSHPVAARVASSAA